MKKREKSAVITTAASLYYTIISCLFPFIIRTLLIRYIGVEYLGIKGLFESVMQVLSLVNLGADSTFFTYFLYKPCEERNYNRVNAIMGLVRKVYLFFGVITLVVGILIMPLLPTFVDTGTYPEELNIYLIYFIYVLQAALGYFTSYHALLYTPFLLTHINYLAWGTSFIIMYSFQIIAIVFAKDYTLYTAGLLITSVILWFFFILYNRSHMPWLSYKGTLPGYLINDFRWRFFPMILTKIRNVSRNSLDCIIISHFMGLVVLAKYQNYYQIMLVPILLIGIINSSIQPAIGNGISAETPESNYGILRQYTFLHNLVATICLSCLITLIQPFMKVWIGNEYLLGLDIVISIGIYFYVLCIAGIGVVLRDTTGTWAYGKWVAVVETIANLILNILLINILGLVGIILASILTVAFINIPFEFGYVFRFYFHKKYREYFGIVLRDTIITTLITGVSFFICMRVSITNYLSMILRFVLAIFFPFFLFVIFHFRDEEFGETMQLTKKTLRAVRGKMKKGDQ